MTQVEIDKERVAGYAAVDLDLLVFEFNSVQVTVPFRNQVRNWKRKVSRCSFRELHATGVPWCQTMFSDKVKAPGESFRFRPDGLPVARQYMVISLHYQ